MALLLTVSEANAEAPQGWQSEIMPTAWIAGIEGTIMVDGQETDFEKSAGDLFDYVEFAGGLTGGVQYNRWSLRAQFNYFSLSTDALDVEDRPTGGKLDSDMLLLEATAGYWLGSLVEGGSNYLLVGMRLLHSENDLEVYGDDGGMYSKDSDLLDPLVGLRGSFPILRSKIKGLSIVAMATIGGGGDSKLIYGLSPMLQYQFTDKIAARVGFRRAGWRVENDENGGELDFALSGLSGGIAVTF